MKQHRATEQEWDNLAKWLAEQSAAGVAVPPWERVIFGYDTLVRNCADLSNTTLEFSPAILAAREDKALLDAFDLAGRKDDVQARQISEDECEPELIGHFWQTPTVQSSSCRDAIRAAIG